MYQNPRPTSDDRFFFHKERYSEYCGSPLEALRHLLKGLTDIIGGVCYVIVSVVGTITTSLMWVATRYPLIIPVVSCLAFLGFTAWRKLS